MSTPARIYHRPLIGRPEDRLTDRDHQIIRLVCLCPGSNYAELAGILRTTEQTLKNRLKRIYDFTGTSVRGELILWFFFRALEAGETPEQLQDQQEQFYKLVDSVMAR